MVPGWFFAVVNGRDTNHVGVTFYYATKPGKAPEPAILHVDSAGIWTDITTMPCPVTMDMHPKGAKLGKFLECVSRWERRFRGE
jgi:hypothetical protein